MRFKTPKNRGNLNATKPSFFFSRSNRFYIKLGVRKRRLTFIIRKHLPMVIAQDAAASLPEILSRWCHIVFHPNRKGENVRITQPNQYPYYLAFSKDVLLKTSRSYSWVLMIAQARFIGANFPEN